MTPVRLLFLAASLCAAQPVLAFDFRSVGEEPAIMYDAPSTRGIKRFIAPPGMPVEVVHTAPGWSKVRDAVGDMAWVESKSISAKHTVVVTAASAVVRARPDEAAPPVFSASKGVLLDIVEPVVSGWVKVRHRDGEVGHVRASQVWGR
ncbi:MAG: hypothetical protein H6R01_842 [Burkholderiaceae bacterium]|nr:hypothetical protein [Burkholderiaceae bacterium]